MMKNLTSAPLWRENPLTGDFFESPSFRQAKVKLSGSLILWKQAFKILLVVGIFTLGIISVFLPKTQSAIEGSEPIILAVNQVRIEKGLAPLKVNPELETAALAKARDILNQDYFEHQSPSGLTPWTLIEEAGYNYQKAGENLAIDFIEPEQAFEAWMKSDSHRQNILNPSFEETGIAYLTGEFGSRQTLVIVQLFGQPQNPLGKILGDLSINQK